MSTAYHFTFEPHWWHAPLAFWVHVPVDAAAGQFEPPAPAAVAHKSYAVLHVSFDRHELVLTARPNSLTTSSRCWRRSTGVYGDGGLVQLAGGIASATGAIEAASVTAKAVTPAVITVLFADAQCFAQTTAADPSKVGSITCTFPADRAISLANGLTTAALVNQILVTVLSNDYGAPVCCQ